MSSAELGYDYSKLKGRMAELGFTGKAIASAVGMAASTFSLKLNNRGEFSQGEICRIMEILQIDRADVSHYFFCNDCSV